MVKPSSGDKVRHQGRSKDQISCLSKKDRSQIRSPKTESRKKSERRIPKRTCLQTSYLPISHWHKLHLGIFERQFPLTLSPRRGNRSLGALINRCLRWLARLGTILPLPKGRGEGERSVVYPAVSVIEAPTGNLRSCEIGRLVEAPGTRAGAAMNWPER